MLIDKNQRLIKSFLPINYWHDSAKVVGFIVKEEKSSAGIKDQSRIKVGTSPE